MELQDVVMIIKDWNFLVPAALWAGVESRKQLRTRALRRTLWGEAAKSGADVVLMSETARRDPDLTSLGSVDDAMSMQVVRNALEALRVESAARVGDGAQTLGGRADAGLTVRVGSGSAGSSVEDAIRTAVPDFEFIGRGLRIGADTYAATLHADQSGSVRLEQEIALMVSTLTSATRQKRVIYLTARYPSSLLRLSQRLSRPTKDLTNSIPEDQSWAVVFIWDSRDDKWTAAKYSIQGQTIHRI